MNAIPLINNIPKTNINNEKQLRQEINTSLVALKKEAGTLEGLINEAAQMLVTINNRIATLENDTVKKSDIVDVVQSGNLQPVTSNAVADKISSLDVSSVGGSGKYISAISETDGKINATATDLGNMVPVDTVTSGNMHSVTSNAVAQAMNESILISENLIGTFTIQGGQTISVDITGFIPATPQGYERFTQLYVLGQNFLQSSVQFVGNTVYMTLTNLYSSSLSYDVYTWVMYFKNVSYI